MIDLSQNDDYHEQNSLKRSLKGAVSREILPSLKKTKLQYLYLFKKQY